MIADDLETWLPLLSILLVAVSYVLHVFYKSDKGMSVKESLANVSIFIVWKYIFFAGGITLQRVFFTWLSKFSLFHFESTTNTRHRPIETSVSIFVSI